MKAQERLRAHLEAARAVIADLAHYPEDEVLLACAVVRDTSTDQDEVEEAIALADRLDGATVHPKPQDMAAIEAEAFHADIELVLQNMQSGLALKHQVNPVSVCLAGIETLTAYASSVSPEGIAKYLAALAWVMREKAAGEVSDPAATELQRAIQQIAADVALFVQDAGGSA